MQTQTQAKPVSTFQQIRSVLTENQQAALIDLREESSSIQWQAGDLVNDLYMQIMANNVQASIMDVCSFVSDEIYNLFAPTTLRIYSAVAKFYPVLDRASFDNYSFWIFRYATRFEADWHKVMDYVDEFCDKHARQPYEREVRAYFEPAQELLNQVTPAPGAEDYVIQLPPEIQAIEQAALTNACKSSLKVIITGLLNLIAPTISELQDPTAKQLLAQIGSMAKQLLEQYL
jgi:hypothetical protein